MEHRTPKKSNRTLSLARNNAEKRPAKRGTRSEHRGEQRGERRSAPRGESRAEQRTERRETRAPMARHAQPKERQRPSRKEIKFYGVNACRALWRTRPQDVIRIYVTQDLVRPLGDMLKWAANERKAYHIVEPADLERLTESVHHQGVCVLAYEHSRLSFGDLRAGLRDGKSPAWLIYLDGVENPHNFGAILRTAAHFGAGFVLGDAQRLPTLSPSACRIAEGGAEHITVVALDDPLVQLRELQKSGYTLIAADVRDGSPIYQHTFNRKTVLIVGAEEIGLSARLRRLADTVVTIPGSTDVESLNVSVAFGVLSSELFRQLQAAK